MTPAPGVIFHASARTIRMADFGGVRRNGHVALKSIQLAGFPNGRDLILPRIGRFERRTFWVGDFAETPPHRGELSVAAEFGTVEGQPVDWKVGGTRGGHFGSFRDRRII